MTRADGAGLARVKGKLTAAGAFEIKYLGAYIITYQAMLTNLPVQPA